MENIIAAEILCTKLQDSDKPLEIGIGMALRVVLDENIVLEERAQNLAQKHKSLRESYKELSIKYSNYRETIEQLKEANSVLTVELEKANALIKLYKERNIGNSRAVLLRGEVTVIDSITKVHELLKPQQNSIQFPEETESAPAARPVNEREESVYYRAALKRAKKIWRFALKISTTEEVTNLKIFVDKTSEIIDWVNVFYIKPTELTYNHIEAACMPKCYGGLGIIIGMKLESWVESQIKNK